LKLHAALELFKGRYKGSFLGGSARRGGLERQLLIQKKRGMVEEGEKKKRIVPTPIEPILWPFCR
jgi:hypothetical protein